MYLVCIFLILNWLISGDAATGNDAIEDSLNPGGNTNSTSEKLNSLKDNANEDSIVEKDVIQGGGVLGQYTEDEGMRKKSKDPSSDEDPPSNERESSKKGDKLPESYCLDEACDNVGVPLPSPAYSPGNCLAERKETLYFCTSSKIARFRCGL
jgi:hypothetical protein